jgi:hypothetical protein
MARSWLQSYSQPAGNMLQQTPIFYGMSIHHVTGSQQGKNTSSTAMAGVMHTHGACGTRLTQVLINLKAPAQTTMANINLLNTAKGPSP